MGWLGALLARGQWALASRSGVRAARTFATWRPLLSAAAPTAAKAFFRKDYVPPSYRIESTDLTFVLHETKTDVVAKLRVSPRESATVPLQLAGCKSLELTGLAVNGKALAPSDFSRNSDGYGNHEHFVSACQTNDTQWVETVAVSNFSIANAPSCSVLSEASVGSNN